jgi:polysaccharide biosynthesis protein PslH
VNLLFVTPGFVYPLVGGQSIRTFNFLKELKALGVSTTVITIREPGSDGKFIEAMQPFCHAVIPVAADPDRQRSAVAKIALKVRPEPATMVRYYDRGFHDVVRRVVAEGEFDAVLCDQLHMAAYCHDIPLPKVLNTDDPLYVQLARDARVATSLSARLKLQWEAAKYRRYERRMFRAFDSVLFVSAADREVVQQDLGVHNIEIIPQGVDLELFTPEGPDWAEAPAEPYVLISGMMNYGPNAKSAVYFVEQVLPLVRQQRPDVKCVIMGAYPTEEVQALGRDHDGVIITGFVEDVLPYFRSAAVYAAPAVSGTGIKNKVLQAMAMEKGIVATKLSMDGIPQARDGECVLLAETPEGLAEATVTLLEDAALRERLGKQARRCIEEHYGWGPIVRQLYHILQQQKSC